MQSDRLIEYLWKMEDQPGFGNLAPVTVFSVSFLGDTPLHVAVRRGDIEIVAEMLEAGADIDAIGQDGFSALHFAVMFDDVPIVLLLLENGASISTMSDWDESPLDSAARRGTKAIVEAIQSKMTRS
ncbi:MAG: ankyrin repeat domain-containing protein [Verrucomicrobiaceae bacterium]|nr:MAG: ankyrin repeat domain-containing protein [Verrucomicrobiaceae bacterium]